MPSVALHCHAEKLIYCVFYTILVDFLEQLTSIELVDFKRLRL